MDTHRGLAVFLELSSGPLRRSRWAIFLRSLMTQLLWLLTSQCSLLLMPVDTLLLPVPQPDTHAEASTFAHHTWCPATHADGHLWVRWLFPIGHTRPSLSAFEEVAISLCKVTLGLLPAGMTSILQMCTSFKAQFMNMLSPLGPFYWLGGFTLL